MTRLARTSAGRGFRAATMRAAVLTGPRTIEIVDTPRPEPGPGQVRIRIEGCGVCGSNLPAWEGREWFTYPFQAGKPGHEGWGSIDALGPGVNGWRAGQRVAALTYSAFAEYDVADASGVVEMPEALGAAPFPAEAAGCAVNVFGRSGVRAGQTVAVIGIGFLGALVLQQARAAGARVIAVSRREFALGVGRSLGASDGVLLGKPDHVVARVKQLTADALCDVVVEAAGTQETLDLAAELTRERGRLVIAGFHQDGPRRVNMFLWNWRGLDVINAHERDPGVYVRGMRNAAAAAAAGRLSVGALCTHEFPLERAGDAFRAAEERPDGFLKAIVRMREGSA